MKQETKYLLKIILLIFISFYTAFISSAETAFKARKTLSTDINPQVVCIADINNDGLDDIVAGTGFDFNSSLQYTLFIFPQSKSGTFPVTIKYPCPRVYQGLNSITINDVNNDGLKDIVIGYGDSIGIYFQKVTGAFDTFKSYFSGKNVYGVKAADMNSDGLNDIVVSHWSTNFIRVFYQSIPAGFFDKTYTKPSGGYDEIEVGDVNSDGLNDVIFMAGQGGGGIHIFTQDTLGGLNNFVSYYPPGSGFLSLDGVAIYDLNNDGANDIVGTYNDSLIIWYQDTSSKLFNQPVEFSAYINAESVEVADFNCDGKPEIFVYHGGWSSLSVFHQDDRGDYSTYDIYSPLPMQTHPKPQSLSKGDINNDGLLDIVTTGEGGIINLFYNTSIPSTFTKIDTLIKIDTTSSKRDTIINYFAETSIDTIENFIIRQIDSFKVINVYQIDTVRTDSIFWRNGQICSINYHDTVSILNTSFYRTIITHDTMHWSTTLDSIPTSGIFDSININEIFQLFPNPTKDKIYFKIDAGINSNQIFIKVINPYGREIITKNANSAHDFYVDITGCPDGIYLFVIEVNGIRVCKKLSKIH